MNPSTKSKKSNSEESLTLAIETAIAGGSLALVQNGVELDSWIGSKEVSKAEDVLAQIDELLKKNEIKKTRLSLIKVSNGPGSSTGLKIGLAIAKGLAGALQIRVETVSAATALLAAADFDRKKILIVLPFGKNLFFAQFYERTGSGNFKLVQRDTETSGIEQFQESLKAVDFEQLVFHPECFTSWKTRSWSDQANPKINSKIKVVSGNLAAFIG